MKPNLKKFFLPSISKQFSLRVLVVAVVAYLLFGFIFLPFRITGYSMEPAYKNGSFNFCFKQRYILSKPDRYDVICIRLAGEKVILLKRVVALEGEIVEIRNGVFFVDGKELDEVYVTGASNWDLAPRKVEKGHAYVVGDNRSVSINVHQFGQTLVNRIIGAPLW